MLGDRFASNVFLVGKPDDDVGVAFSPIARLIAAFVSLAPKKAFSGSSNSIVKALRESRSGEVQNVVLCNLIFPE